MKLTWTVERLRRDFRRYNRFYFADEIAPCLFRVDNLSSVQAHFEPQLRRITIDADLHESDDAVRKTLLHMMCHAASSTPDSQLHNDGFLEYFERLISKGFAPPARLPDEVGQTLRDLVVHSRFRRVRQVAGYPSGM